MATLWMMVKMLATAIIMLIGGVGVATAMELLAAGKAEGAIWLIVYILIAPMLVVCLWWRRHQPYIVKARKAYRIITTVFSDDDVACDLEKEDPDAVSDAGVIKIRRKRKIHYAARVALIAKSQVGQLSRTKANELVYQRICREEMVKHGVRPTHIARILPLAVAACYIATEEELVADAILSLPETKGRAGALE